MFKTLTLFVLAMGVVVAFAAPAAFASLAATSANPEEAFTALALDVEVESPSEALLTCETVELNGVWGEDVTAVEPLSSSGPFGGSAHNEGNTPCGTSNSAIIADVSNITVRNFSLEITSGSAELTFTATLTLASSPGTPIGYCHFDAWLPLDYPHHQDLELTVAGEYQLTQTESTCPFAAQFENATITATFTVVDANEEPIIISTL